LFAEGGIGFAGGILGVNGELEFAPAAADLNAKWRVENMGQSPEALSGECDCEIKVARAATALHFLRWLYLFCSLTRE